MELRGEKNIVEEECPYCGKEAKLISYKKEDGFKTHFLCSHVNRVTLNLIVFKSNGSTKMREIDINEGFE